MSESLLFAFGGVILMIAIGALAIYGITYSKSKLRVVVGDDFDGFKNAENKPGTPV
jgi:hypothetical protein